MLKRLCLLVTIAILLLSPVASLSKVTENSATSTSENNITVELMYINQTGSFVEKFNLSEIDWQNLTKIIYEFISNLTKAIINISSNNTSNISFPSNFTNITNPFEKFYENRTLLKIWYKIQSRRPLQKRVFIVSTGYGRRFDFRPFATLSFFKPFTFWFYFGGKNYTNRSTTIIVDPILPKVKILKGLQFGMMRRFIGIFIRISGTPLQKSHLFFMGYAYKVRVIAQHTTIYPDPKEMKITKT